MTALGLFLVTLLPATSISFTHGHVVDVVRGTVARDVTVVVSDDRVVFVGTHGAPKSDRTIDVGGKYVMPGLWDMHVHWYEASSSSLFIANGVTGVRQMFGTPRLLELRDAIRAGTVVGPRQYLASPIFDGKDPYWPGSIEITAPSQVAAAIAAQKKAGYDFIKVYSKLTRENFLAIAAEAKKQGIPFAGHVPDTVAALEASRVGMASMEHSYNLAIATSSVEVDLLQQQGKLWEDFTWEKKQTLFEQLYALQARTLETQDAAQTDYVYRALANNGTAVSPTLTVQRPFEWVNRQDPHLQLIKRAMRDEWAANSRDKAQRISRAQHVLQEQRFRLEMAHLVIARRVGVTILAGTDVMNDYCLPGFSLLDELELLVEAGLTPLHALQAATINPALFLKLEAGEVAAGKLADLIVLDANPLDDVANVRRLSLVVAAGRVFDRAALDALLLEQKRVGSLFDIGAEMGRVLDEEGMAAAWQLHRAALKQPDKYDTGEESLNTLGYRLLYASRVTEAAEVLKRNAELFPQSANAFDGACEALVAAGDRPGAKSACKRAIDLNPANEAARKRLSAL